MPDYGWVFGMGDGTCSVGLSVLNTSRSFQKTDYRELMKCWLVNTSGEQDFREENRLEKIQGAALPMTFNRQPIYGRGLPLVGDSGGVVSSFNGEGIACTIGSTELATDVITQAHAHGVGTEFAEHAPHGYRTQPKTRLGGYYRPGIIFVRPVSDPHVMYLCITCGLPRKILMRFVMKLLVSLTDNHGGSVMDHVINALCRVAPAA